MKNYSKIGLVLAVFTITLSLAACGDDTATSNPLPATAVTTAAPAATPTVTRGTTTTGATTAATTGASTTVVSTTVVTTAAATTSATTAAPATTPAVATEPPTRNDATTQAATTPATTTAPQTTKAASLPSIRQTDWQTVLKNDPQLRQEPPPDSYLKFYISVKADQQLVGSPDLDHIVYVDVDKDGQEEAAIPLISGGTAGNIGFLLYRQAAPAPRLIGWQEGYKQGLKAVEGKLESTNALYSGWEPNCCPSGFETLTYGLMGDKLIVVGSRTDGYAEAQPPTVEEFYSLLNDKKYEDAYEFLSPNFQKANPFASWVAGYATSQKVTAQTVADASAPNLVRVNLETTDSGKSGPVIKHYNGTWTLVWSADRKGWLLDSAKIQEVAGTNGSTAKVLALFQPLLDPLKQQTTLQILLPTEIVSAPRQYATIEKVDTSSFVIALGRTPDCNGANACDFGSISGQVVGLDPNPLTGTKVALANGETGYYQDAPCGASCGEATITWEQGGVRYIFGGKGMGQFDLLKMVNSAITNGPV
jgi:hypothetical protein